MGQTYRFQMRLSNGEEIPRATLTSEAFRRSLWEAFNAGWYAANIMGVESDIPVIEHGGEYPVIAVYCHGGTLPYRTDEEFKHGLGLVQTHLETILSEAGGIYRTYYVGVTEDSKPGNQLAENISHIESTELPALEWLKGGWKSDAVLLVAVLGSGALALYMLKK